MKSLRILLGITAVLVCLVVLRQLADTFVVFLQALFLACIAQAPIRWLVAKGVNAGIAIAGVVSVMAVAVGLLIYFVGHAAFAVVAKAPTYSQRADELLATMGQWLLRFRISVPPGSLSRHINPEQVIAGAGTAVMGLGGVVFHEVLMFLTLIFLLIEFQRLPQKLAHLSSNPEKAQGDLRAMSEAMTRYIAIKTMIAGASGISSWIALEIIGVDQALLWAVMTFLLNYIPDIGPILSAIPPALFALFEQGPLAMLWVILAYVIIKMIFGNVIGPGLLGRHLNLSPVAILASIGVWGWAFGSTGVFLGVPITAALKLIFEKHEETRWFAVLVSAHPELVPPLTAPEHGNQA